MMPLLALLLAYLLGAIPFGYLLVKWKTGADVRSNYEFAAKIMKQIKQIPGTVDTHIHQRLDLPTLALQMDRSQLQLLGLSANDVAQNLLATTAGTTQTSPGFWRPIRSR